MTLMSLPPQSRSDQVQPHATAGVLVATTRPPDRQSGDPRHTTLLDASPTIAQPQRQPTQCNRNLTGASRAHVRTEAARSAVAVPELSLFALDEAAPAVPSLPEPCSPCAAHPIGAPYSNATLGGPRLRRLEASLLPTAVLTEEDEDDDGPRPDREDEDRLRLDFTM